MMILGESNRPNPTVQIPSWTLVFDDPTAAMVYGHDGGGGGGGGPGDCSPFVLGDTFAAALHLHRYLPSNAEDSGPGRESDFALALDDEYSSSDEFRMFEFKVRRCGRGRAHDWTECPFAHLGEKAKRRDPRKFHYSGTACPDFRKGSCRRGEACDYAHGVFECWLHPARYRTQPCKDGTACRRRVCFFAHTPDQLRLLPHHHQHSPKAASASVESYDGSPLPKAASLASSPTSTLVSPPFSPSSDSPPLSPNGPSIRRGMLSNSVNEVLAFSLRQLQLSNAKSSSPWGVQVFSSSPSTPTTALKTAGMGLGRMDLWEKEAETMDRVESGRDLRAKVFEKLSRENAVTPDVGWVSELVK